jgi:cell wall-associated NlpC family hydrolase
LGRAEILVDKIQPHAGPFDGSKKLDAITKGGEAKALAEKPGWVKLQLSTGIGWLPTSAVKLTSAVPLAESLAAASKPAAVASKIVKAKKPTLVASNSENPIIKSAFGYRGVRYRWGGMSRSSGVDCSGFTSSVFRSQGISLPRTALQQSHVGDPVSKSALQAGDLIFFRTNRSVRVNHVGIYIGEGKFMHAATSAGHVMVSSLSDPYYVRAYATARRVADFNAAARTSRILDEATEL